MTTIQTSSPHAARAAELFAGRLDLDGADIAALETAMAREGDRDLARRLHERRFERDTARADAILSGQATGPADPAEVLELAKRLAGDKSIGLARRLLNATRDTESARTSANFVKIVQKNALYTYKDPDLPADWRLNEALEILQTIGQLSESSDCESLGLAGAIFKRKWEVDSVRSHLERALFYYLRGYALGAPAGAREDIVGYLEREPLCTMNAQKDRGYTGINAAFILDLLARQEEEEAARAGMRAPAAQQRRRGAQLIREEIIRSVPALLDDPANASLKEEWWFYATVGEAYFGLGAVEPKHYGNAIDWLVTRPAAAGLERRVGATSTGALDVPEWEYESTARQLARLALLQGSPDASEADFEASQAGRALTVILQDDHEAVRSAFRGKFGLALSGGGFRASLFHIGVLASLAEHGVLPHVEVLSCVSGGSIIGARYYLELRHLLQTRTDAEIDSRDYVTIVQRIEKEFLAGVQRNIRMRILAEWTTNLKLIFKPGYSRTLRVGELYERELFRTVPDGEFTGPRWLPEWLAEWFGCKRKRWLNALFIHPLIGGGRRDAAFLPRYHNWRRVNKVPVLVLNATTLNTGHCWQFTASLMGEPPTRINSEIDANDRLRRMWYRDAPTPHRRVRLGHAVAASSCVPGLFEPLILDKLYPRRSVRLVDGGVCDNQGVSSLLEQDCTVPLISDASGQMETQAIPSSSVIGVPLRANSVLQARVRQSQYAEVKARRQSQLLQGMMFLHLKQGLVGEPIAWEEVPPPLRESDFAPKKKTPDEEAASHEVSPVMKKKLAAIRTDLDSFNDLEAYALMAAGYRMTKAQLTASEPPIRGFAEVVASGSWDFAAVDRALLPPDAAPDAEAQRGHLAAILDAGAGMAFKVWKLSPVLAALKWILAAAAAALAASFVYARWQTAVIAALPDAVSRLTVGAAAVALLTPIAAAILAIVADRLLGEEYGRGVVKAIRWRDTLRSVIIGFALAAGGFLVARLHLHLFDRWYLITGSVARMPKAAPRANV
jgi:predicted acylesterase/phospholipase RssA